MASTKSPAKKPFSKKAPKTKPFKAEWKPELGLTQNEEVFCRYFVINEATRRNATLSYAAAYGYDLDNAPKNDAVYAGEEEYEGEEGEMLTRRGKLIKPSTYDAMYNVCSVGGSKLLRIAKIARRNTELLNEYLEDNIVDGELAKVIMQDEELTPKVNSIKEYNMLRKRTSNTVQHVHAYSDIKGMSDEELRAEKEKLQNFFNKK